MYARETNLTLRTPPMGDTAYQYKKIKSRRVSQRGGLKTTSVIIQSFYLCV